MYREYAPSPLSHFVSAIWYADSAVDPDEGHIVYPTLSAELVIKVYPSDVETVLSGPTTEQKRYPVVEGAHYWGIRFVAGVGPLFGSILLKDLRDTSVDVNTVLGIDLTTLAHRLHDSRGWIDQKALIETAICQQYPGHTHSLDHNVSLAIRIASRFHGNISVEELATMAGVSRRHLERLFLVHVGVSPKTFCKTIRLQRVLNSLQNNPSVSLASLALDCGYTDQAHLANEFKRAMGTSIRRPAKGFGNSK